jgi:hypothetical protein
MNENLEIMPGKSIGTYRLGMSRQDVWAQNRCPITCFYKTETSIQRTDDIELLGIHVHYDENEKCNLIEAWTQVQYNKSLLMIEAISLNGQSMGDIQSLCEMLPFNFDKLDSGFESNEAGIGFYCHDYESEDSLLDGVYIMYPSEKNS